MLTPQMVSNFKDELTTNKFRASGNTLSKDDRNSRIEKLQGHMLAVRSTRTKKSIGEFLQKLGVDIAKETPPKVEEAPKAEAVSSSDAPKAEDAPKAMEAPPAMQGFDASENMPETVEELRNELMWRRYWHMCYRRREDLQDAIFD